RSSCMASAASTASAPFSTRASACSSVIPGPVIPKPTGLPARNPTSRRALGTTAMSASSWRVSTLLTAPTATAPSTSGRTRSIGPEHEVVRIHRMLPGPSVEEVGELDLIGCLFLVNHHAEDVPADIRLDGLQAEVRRERTVFVHGLPADHAQGQDEVATPVEEDPRAGREVLDPWDGVALDDEAASLLPELVDRGRGHVVPGERCVDDSDSLQAFRLRRGAGGSAGTSTLPRSTSDSRSWSASHSATFLTIFRVPSRSPSNFGSRTTFVESPRFRHSSRIRFSSWTWSKPMATTSGRISSKMS